ncbi:MAG: ABC transporter permease subunit [Pseudomonadota bacterium]|nr:ABC transporter permease subunit [Pseudomonadota bacterium]
MALFAAFWALPMLRLATLPASQGWPAYAAVLTEPRYLRSLLQTTGLAITVTAATLVLAGGVGLFVGRERFAGRRALLAVLTLPLSFPGVIVGFFVILIGGRQGPLASWTEAWFGHAWSLAYGLPGLVMAYLYFSLPRAIGAFAAAAERLDPQLEEAARSLGAGRWPIARDVWLPGLVPTAIAAGGMVFATAMGAFGTAFTLASRFEVLPITIYNEFTNHANFALAAALSMALGLMTWGVLFFARRFGAATLAAAA